MSIAELGFKICDSLYQTLPATMGSAGVTYLAARYISWLNLPPRESARFAGIFSIVTTLYFTTTKELGYQEPKSALQIYLPPFTLGSLVAYELYSHVNPVPGMWPFVKLCTIAFGAYAGIRATCC